MSSISVECNVCCEEVKSSIFCGNCKWVSCIPCTETFLLSVPNARCMQCKAEFTEHFLRMYLSPSWIDRKYKPYIKEQQFAHERSLMSDDVEITQLYRQLKQAQSNLELFKTLCAGDGAEFSSENIILKDQEQAKVEQLNRIYTAMLDNNYTSVDQVDEKISCVPSKKKFNRPCVQPNCKGFIDENNFEGWKCGLCEVVICKECRVVKLKNHTCDQGTLESIKLIEKETRPCPTCAEPIFKPYGCDHMFCTICKTNFSWKSAKLIPASQQTNPLYRQYIATMQEQNRQQNTNNTMRNTVLDCSITVNQFLNTSTYRNYVFYDTWNVRFLTSVTLDNPNLTNFKYGRYVFSLISSLFNHVNPDTLSNREERIKYLNNELNDKAFMQKIYANFKNKEYERDIYNLAQATNQCLMEWNIALIDHLKREFASIIKVAKQYKQFGWNRLNEEVIQYFNKNNTNSFITCINKVEQIKGTDQTQHTLFNYNIRAWDQYKEINNIINFFNKTSIEIAELYGYKTTHAILYDETKNKFNYKVTSIKKINTNITLR